LEEEQTSNSEAEAPVPTGLCKNHTRAYYRYIITLISEGPTYIFIYFVSVIDEVSLK
jgi:hypothetical protein